MPALEGAHERRIRRRSPDGRSVLKVYGRNWRTESEVRYEVALIRHLSAGGLPTAAPVACSDGDFVTSVEAADGRRPAVLFEYAPGQKPQSPFTPWLYRDFGAAVALMHGLSDDFVTGHRRRPLDTTHTIDEPLALAAPFLEEPDDREFLRTFGLWMGRISYNRCSQSTLGPGLSFRTVL